jgi:hypothetical protein
MKDYLAKHFREYWAADRTACDDKLASIEWPLEKPPAFVTIDDRAMTFTGRWPSMMELKNFKPWNKREFDDRPLAMPLREQRVNFAVAFLMETLRLFVPHDRLKSCVRDLSDRLHDAGVEMITDDVRAQAGLPRRGDLGLTAQELHVLEAKRMEMMMHPIRHPILDMAAVEAKKAGGMI